METSPEKPDTGMICSHCGQERKEKARFCVSCGNPFPQSSVGRKRRYVLYGTVILVCMAVFGSFLITAGESSLVAKVNGQGISRKEFSKRMDRAKRFYEKHYGQNLFQEVYCGLSSESNYASDWFTFANAKVPYGGFCVFLNGSLPCNFL